jgi:flagellar basal-body rod modification protein FlgD
MQIQNQSSLLNASSATTSQTKPAANAGGMDALANEHTFLQLLVSQVKNQDPLNPADSTQFLSQLTQLSQLEQLVAIRQQMTGTGAPTAVTTGQSTPNS